MKSISALRLAFLFAGCFLGAGFVSGQELWQYFGVFGSMGYLGLAISVFLLFLMGLLVVTLAHLSGKTMPADLICPWKFPPLRTSVSLLQMLQLLVIVVVMTAAVGALFHQVFGIPPVVGAAGFILLIFAASFFNLEGVLAAFSISVPLLVVSVLLFTGKALSVCQLQLPAMDKTADGNLLLSAVNYACFNIFASIAILGPFAEFIATRKTMVTGIGLGALVAGLIASGVLVCLQVWRSSVSAELPMLEAASALGSAFMYVYAFLLLAAMFGTALSSFVTLRRHLENVLRSRHAKPIVLAGILAAASFGCSLVGFRKLIGILYPIFGYASAVCIVLMLVHLILRRKKNAVF